MARELARLVGLGLQMAAWTGLFAYGGHLCDAWLGTGRALLITGCLVGGGIGITDAIRTYLRVSRNEDDTRDPL